MKQPPKVDFAALVNTMQQAGAFADYPRPLGGSDASALGPNFHNPRFPGDKAFILGSNAVKEGTNIPQDLADANKRAFMDAVNTFMPMETTAQWMHEYFSPEKNFIHSKQFRSFVTDLSTTPAVTRNLLDSELTMKLDDKQRSRDDQHLFTPEEIHITRRVSEAVPAIPLAIVAYQASLVDYLGHLDKAIGSSRTLSMQEKKRGHDIVGKLKEGFAAKGTIQHMLPAIATHYHKNHGQNTGEPSTEQDFREGIHFMMKNGSFRQTVPYRDNTDEVRFSCPVQPFIGKSSATSLENGPSDSPAVSSQFGVALYHIYREADAKLKESPQAFKQISRDMGYVLDSILTVRQQGGNGTGGLLDTLRGWLR